MELVPEHATSIMLMFDDPKQIPAEEVRCRIGFIFEDDAWSQILEKTDAYPEIHIIKINGNFARVVLENADPADLGKIHKYLWKDYMPKHKVSPKTGPFDFCIQTFSSCDGDRGKCEVLIPIE
eukprot:Gregarina_sp_Poly_1__10855@NODE_842_length_6017_cov_94_978151_g609_i0_p5_GENE_NODE_842_length_6017_cov_94_978151_g609_i0NODE_842_length_6017_cov_94_978151_g609_i0_p5_ORF_typecomplete_len123_score20_24GyrIlike/PF06445_15/8_2e05Cass2/PF14526_6/0_017_NODE_842_length_6017_cov_94_978151_g609_i0215583